MNYYIKPASDFMVKAQERYFRRSSATAGTRLCWSGIPFGVRPQELSIWSGHPGHGKSAFLSMIAVHLAKEGQRTVIASFEMPADQTIARMVRQSLGHGDASAGQVADCIQWLGEHIYIYDHVGRVTKQGEMLDNFRMSSEADGIDHFQVDSLLKCGMAEDDYNGQKRLVEDLHNFAMGNNCHVNLVAHSRKGQDEGYIPGKMDVAHSGSIAQLANNGFTVWRNTKKELAVAAGEFKGDEPDAVLWCWKSREFGPEEEGKYGLWYNHQAVQYLERSANDTKVFYDSAPF